MTMRTDSAVALLLLAPLGALPQEQDLKNAMAECAALVAASDRLDCFDSLARGLARMPAAPVPVLDPGSLQSRTPDQWTVEVVRDPIDDTARVVLSLMGKDTQAELALRCRQKRPEVLLNWRGRFIGATPPVVWTRLGPAKAEKKRWSLSTDHKAAFFPGDPKPFIRQLLSADRLVVQTDHFAKGTITDVFDLHGLKDVITPLKDECSLE